MQLVLPARPVSLDLPDQVASPALQAPLVRPAHLAGLVREVSPDLQEALDFLERQGNPAFRDLLELEALLEQQGRLGYREVRDEREPLEVPA